MTKQQAPQGAPDTPPQGGPEDAPQGADTSPPQGTADTAPQGADAKPQGDANEDLPDASQDWQALARKWERQAKKDHESLESLRKRMQGLLTPEQVADQAEAAAAAQSAAATASTEALRLRVALEKNVPAGLVDRLIGTTREELEADAVLLLSTMTPPPADNPRIPDASAGTGRATPPAKRDPNELLRIAAGVQAAS